MADTLGFVGLGAMGAAIARNLLKAGYGLRVYNRSPEKADALVAAGAVRVDTPGQAAVSGGIVFTMLSNDQAVEAVTHGNDGLLDALGEGGIHVSMSTISPGLAQKLAQDHAARGQHYLAAPVFGKPDAAAAAKLWIPVSGTLVAKDRARPFLEAVGQGIFDFGEEVGAANVVKLCGNFLLGAAIEAMAEAYTLAEKSGVSRTQVHDLFSRTLFACPVYQNYGKMVATQSYEPVGAVPSLIRKDFGLVLQQAQTSLVPMPIAGLVHDRLTATVAKGRDDKDWAGFAREVSDSAGG